MKNNQSNTQAPLDPSHRLLLMSALPLLKSRNSGVCVSVCSLLWHAGKQSTHAINNIVTSLVFWLDVGEREVKTLVLGKIYSKILTNPMYCICPQFVS